MIWIYVILSISLGLGVWSAISLFNNYMIARETNLPLAVKPVNALNPLWQLVQKPIAPYLRLIPAPFTGIFSLSYAGWPFDDKYRVHKKLGPCFVHVHPGKNEVIVADPGAAHTILSDRKAFIKPPFFYDVLNVFGKNLDTVNGADWQRHRRLTAPSFNEKISGVVWKESIRQAQDMLHHWVKLDQDGTDKVVEDTRIVALHVIDHAGFGITNDFSGGVVEPGAGHEMSYRDSMLLILSNVLLVFILPVETLLSSFMPKSFRQVGLALTEFKRYMEEMIVNERKNVSSQDLPGSNLISALVQASDEAKFSPDQTIQRHSLSDEELYGNIFIYSFAGHETTANALAYAITLLAANPEYQDWIVEEIQQVLGDRSDLDYGMLFPRLKRVLSVMLEVLRLYGPVVYLPKYTGNSSQSFPLLGKTQIVPPDTLVIINLQALHTDPEAWGHASLTWRPNRWITASESSAEQSLAESHKIDAETIIEPAQGSYMPWADGPRVCPGKKFAQVEFVAVIAMLFRRHRVRPIPQKGENDQQARARIKAIVTDSGIGAVTLQMRDPTGFRLAWSLRQEEN